MTIGLAPDVLPKGWTRVPLADVVTHRSGNSKLIKGKLHSEPGPDLVPAFSASGQDVWCDNAEHQGEAIIVSAVGARCGKAFYATGSWSAIANTHVVWPERKSIRPRFLWYLINNENYWVRGGTAQPFVKVRLSLERPIGLPPLADQESIVEAIETQFTRLDAAEQALERAQANLKRYRASVLKAAVEGRLVPTEAELARQEGRDYEPAGVLLERILTERRRRWAEAELAKMKAKGKEPKNDNWKKKYKPPQPPDTDNLPELPEGWCWATVDAIAEVQGGITKGQKHKADEKYREVPYLRVANVQRGYLDLREMKTIEASENQIAKLQLAEGDVLFNEGGDRDKLGRGWVWKGEIAECIHQNHVFRARILTGDLLPELLSWYGNTNGKAYFIGQGKQTTNLASINMTKLRALPVPIPPLAEQQRICTSTEEQLSVIDVLDRTLELNLTRCRGLRESILKWAFEGKLVEADCNLATSA